MKINTARNAEIDAVVREFISANSGAIDPREVYIALDHRRLLPLIDGERWVLLDLLKYLCIYWHCVMSGSKIGGSSVDDFMRRQLKMFDKPEGEK